MTLDTVLSISFKLPSLFLTKVLENHFVLNIISHIILAKQAKFGKLFGAENIENVCNAISLFTLHHSQAPK